MTLSPHSPARMPTLDTRPIELAPLRRSAAAAGVHADAQAAFDPRGIGGRFITRFAFIAFGLYHVPLFLNNYPSFGGGGFDDKGLAVSWGHVFTAPGIWFARRLFHMTGPMIQSAAGDNGDVGEEFARLLLAIGVGVIAAVVWTIADRRRPRAPWVGGALQTLLRYSIILGLASYAIAKILPMQFPPISGFTLDQRVGDLTPMALLWTFMEYSRPYAFFGGLMELVAVLLLCSRRTATLGAATCLAVMTNVTLLNFSYGVPVKLYATLLAVSAAVLVLYDTPRLIAFFVTGGPVAPASRIPVWQDAMSGRVRWTIKIVLVGSVLLSSVVAMRSAIGQHGTSSGLDGTWAVTSYTRTDGVPDATTSATAWKRMVVQGGSLIVRQTNDVLTGCTRSPSTDSSMIAFTCRGGRHGELRWTVNGKAIDLTGPFDGAAVHITARRLDQADYPLFRSEFRLISDR